MFQSMPDSGHTHVWRRHTEDFMLVHTSCWGESPDGNRRVDSLGVPTALWMFSGLMIFGPWPRPRIYEEMIAVKVR